MAKYTFFSESAASPELWTYETYGIIAKDEDGSVRVLHDVTCEKEKAMALAAAYSEAQLPLSQLDEAIENFLYDFEV